MEGVWELTWLEMLRKWVFTKPRRISIGTAGLRCTISVLQYQLYHSDKQLQSLGSVENFSWRDRRRPKKKVQPSHPRPPNQGNNSGLTVQR